MVTVKVWFREGMSDILILSSIHELYKRRRCKNKHCLGSSQKQKTKNDRGLQRQFLSNKYIHLDLFTTSTSLVFVKKPQLGASYNTKHKIYSTVLPLTTQLQLSTLYVPLRVRKRSYRRTFNFAQIFFQRILHHLRFTHETRKYLGQPRYLLVVVVAVGDCNLLKKTTFFKSTTTL